jgi:hypothetical protein
LRGPLPPQHPYPKLDLASAHPAAQVKDATHFLGALLLCLQKFA